jgi:hypothetical protein
MCLAHFSTLKMEATCSSEMFVDFQWTTLRCIPKIEFFITTAVRSSGHTKWHIVAYRPVAKRPLLGNAATYTHAAIQLGYATLL